MPLYTIRDPTTGKTLKVRGDSPPSETELAELFKAAGAGTTQSASPSLPEMMANVPTDEAGKPLQPAEEPGWFSGWRPQLRQSMESAAFPQTAGEMAGLAVPSGADLAQAVKSGVRSAPTLIGAGVGYATGGVHGAIEGAMGGGLFGIGTRMFKGGRAALEAAREAARLPPAARVGQALKELDTSMQAQYWPVAVNRVAKGENALDVVKDLAAKTPATTAERRAAMGIVKRAPVTAAEDLPAVAAPPAALPPQAAPVPVPATTTSGGLSGYIPKSWEPLAEPGALEPAQPAGKTMSGATQASRPFVPPAQSTRSPASAVNQAMKDLGLRFPARFMDAAIKRVRAGEPAVDVVRFYAEAK